MGSQNQEESTENVKICSVRTEEHEDLTYIQSDQKEEREKASGQSQYSV